MVKRKRREARFDPIGRSASAWNRQRHPLDDVLERAYHALRADGLSKQLARQRASEFVAAILPPEGNHLLARAAQRAWLVDRGGLRAGESLVDVVLRTAAGDIAPSAVHDAAEAVAQGGGDGTSVH